MSSFYDLKVRQLKLVVELEMLHIDCFHTCFPLYYGRLLELPACAKLADSACLLEFPLEFLECLLDIFTFLDRYYNHSSESPPFF